jgi:hypothetical protein
MHRVAVTGWILLIVGTLVLGMRSIGFLHERDAARIEMVSRGATVGDASDDLALETTAAEFNPPTDNASRIAIIAVAFGILLVVLGSPGAAPNERRLIGT